MQASHHQQLQERNKRDNIFTIGTFHLFPSLKSLGSNDKIKQRFQFFFRDISRYDIKFFKQPIQAYSTVSWRQICSAIICREMKAFFHGGDIAGHTRDHFAGPQSVVHHPPDAPAVIGQVLRGAGLIQTCSEARGKVLLGGPSRRRQSIDRSLGGRRSVLVLASRSPSTLAQSAFSKFLCNVMRDNNQIVLTAFII